MAVGRRDDDEKGVTTVGTLGGPQKTTIISESGLYSLVLTSRKPEAKRFKKWVTAEVLPAVRAKGIVGIPTMPVSAAIDAAPDAAKPLLPGGVPALSSKDGRVTTTSRDVAEFFGKRHDDVMKAIRNMLVDLGNDGLRNFADTPWVNAQNGQTYRQYEMDRDGFTLLAMGFTGPQALKFKLAYIAEFNRMEAALRSAPVPLTREQQLAVALRLADDTIRGSLLLIPLEVAGKRPLLQESAISLWY